jgi:hypothetical protein
MRRSHGTGRAPKSKGILWPDWVGRLEDERLRRAVCGALFERDAAVQAGAERHPACMKVLGTADRLLDRIDDRRPRDALRLVAQAVSRYAKAFRCRHPSHAPVWPVTEALPDVTMDVDDAVFWFSPEYEEDLEARPRKPRGAASRRGGR